MPIGRLCGTTVLSPSIAASGVRHYRRLALLEHQYGQTLSPQLVEESFAPIPILKSGVHRKESLL